MAQIPFIDAAGDCFTGELNIHLFRISRWRSFLFLIATVLAVSTGARADYYWTNFAGQDSGLGSADGIGTGARCENPQAITADANGNLYVGDSGSDTIRKISYDSKLYTTLGDVVTLAGFANFRGEHDDSWLRAQFAAPSGIAVDKNGNAFVADNVGQTIRMISPSDVVTTYAGLAYATGTTGGDRLAARFNGPSGLVFDSTGNLYVVDTLNCAIRKIDTTGHVNVFAGSLGQAGSADGQGTLARFANPVGIAIDAQQNLYVADTGNQTIREITPGGLVSTIGGTAQSRGTTDGSKVQARFNSPFAVAVNEQGVVYIAEFSNTTLRVIATDGSVTSLPSSMWSTEVPGFPQQFNEPAGLAYSNGTLYVADYGNHAIRQVSPGPGYPPTARTYTGYPGPSFGTQDGTGSAAMFNDPQGMTVDSSGNVYVADYGNNEIRKITPQGAVSTVFNNAGYFVPIYGVGTHSTFFSPVDVAFDSSGNFYVLESTGSIIKITPSYGVSYLVQNAFVGAQAFAIDKSNNLYVTDTNKNVIDKITPNGTVTTIAGVPGVAGTTDGPAGSALFNQPAGIAVDASGDIFVADTNNHTIRKISPGLQVSTLAGWVDRLGNTDGTGSSAQFCYPRGLAMGLDGSVIVADSSNGQIRQVTQAGVVTTLGGYPGAEADKQGDYRNAQFSFPDHVAVAPSGVVYASQSKANVISSGTSGAQLTLIGSGNGVGFNGQWLVGSQTVSFPAGSFINYGNVSPGYDEVATFTVRNTGNTTFKNLSVQIDGGLNMSYFLVTQPSITTLAPSGQTTFTVGFDPATSGTSTANVHVTSTGGSINSFDFAIYGSWYY